MMLNVTTVKELVVSGCTNTPIVCGLKLVLTLMVEVIVLRGDIGRMNTVFKFYLQVWTLFSISAAASLGWLIPALPIWRPGWRVAWQVVLVVLMGFYLFEWLRWKGK